MGSKKKPTLSQLVKRQEKEKAAQKPEIKRKGEEKTTTKVTLIDEKLVNTIAKEVTKWEYVTPYLVSSKYGVKMSTAIHVLRTLKERGVLALVSKGHRTEIYVPIERVKSLEFHAA